MEIIYDSSELKDYKIVRTRNEEIIQNIENILSRIKGNIPLNREKGIDTEFIDEPINIVQALMVGVVMDEIERDEPRFQVDEIIYDNSNHSSGKLIIKVKGVILDE